MGSTIAVTPSVLEDKTIIIYGASIYGELGYYLLKKIGFQPDFYCDQLDLGKSYLGVPVIKPEDLEHYKSAYIIIASADYFHEIKNRLEEIGCNNICDLSYLLNYIQLDTTVLSARAKGMYANRQNYIDVVNQEQNESSLNFTRVQFVVTERCSLKCKDCLHLMQYYKKPANINLEEVKDSFERFLKVSDNISEIRILGGEPFMNPNTYKIIEWWHQYSVIKRFYIYTNGTIVPNETTLNYLKMPKAKVYVSDYGINRDSINRLISVFEDNGINYYVSPYDGWADAGDLSYRDRNISELEEVFRHCHARNCISFIDGQVHRCPRSAHAMRLRAMPDIKEDYVDIKSFEGDDKELKEMLRRLQNKTWIEACNYCDCADLHVMQIPAGVQTKTPLEYERVN